MSVSTFKCGKPGHKSFQCKTEQKINSGADLNCIKRGIVPIKYCEKTNEGLSSANGTPLNISYKLNKGYIKNDGYCFKNTFLIVDNMTSDPILGTPFLTQISMFVSWDFVLLILLFL